MEKIRKTEQKDNWWWHSFVGHHETTGAEKRFFVEYYIVKSSYLRIQSGAWGDDGDTVARDFSWDQVTLQEEPTIHISADNCFCSGNRVFGKITEENKTIVWDLTLDEKHELEGKVIWKGENYIIHKSSANAYVDCNKDRDFVHPNIWLSSTALSSKITQGLLEQSELHLVAPRSKSGLPFLESKLSGALWYEGTAYEFNTEKFWTLTKTKYKCKVGKDKIKWKVLQETPVSKMETEILCPKVEMLLVSYKDNDGQLRHQKVYRGGEGQGTIKLYNKTLTANAKSRKSKWEWKLVDEIQCENVICEYGVFVEQKGEKNE